METHVRIKDFKILKIKTKKNKNKNKNIGERQWNKPEELGEGN